MNRSAAAVSYHSYGGSAPENYERFFVPAIGTPFAEELLAVAGLRSGERVLDVACGTGIVARLAAGRVGAGGTVAGLDLNPGMLAAARSATPEGLSIEWHQSSAEKMPFTDGSFDVVLSSLGLQFFPDKLAALKEMYRVLTPGGRIAVGTVGPMPPPFGALAEAMARYVKPEAGAFVEQVFSLHDPREFGDLVKSAGFGEVAVDTRTVRLVLPPPNEFLWQYVHSTPIAGLLAQVDDETRGEIERDVVGAWEPYVDDGALIARPSMVVATGRRG